MITIDVRYFAVLREQAGCAGERVRTEASTPAALYAELTAQRGLTLDVALLRVAVNDRYDSMQAVLRDGDRLAFIPPVSGG